MRVHRTAAGFAMAAALSVLSSCYPFMSALPSGAAQGPTIQHVPYSGSFSYSVDTGSTPRDVYFIFTNPSTTTDVAEAPTFASASLTVDGKSLPAPVPQALPVLAKAPQTKQERIAEFNRDPLAHFIPGGTAGRLSNLVSSRTADQDTAGDVYDFVMDMDNFGNPITASNLNATCRYVTPLVTFADGRKRKLSIWVDTANWSIDENNVLGKMTPDRVQAIADHFLHSPTESLADIYHWDTAVVGEPWAHMSTMNYTDWDSDQTITILLGDLNASYTGNSFLVGYFWAKDNYKASYLPASNQRIMFYLDAHLFTKRESGDDPIWAVTDYWPKVEFSTLAHEFQHMIQFYQKQVVFSLNKGTDAWINEMCSMIMEDLVADKQQVEGPRGVPLTVVDGSAGTAPIPDGRIPDFDPYSYVPLVNVDSIDLTGYATAYSFGAWLARNYGGAELLRRIVQCPEINETAVVNAVIDATGNQGETFAGLLGRWAAAVILSKSTNAPTGYQYNRGGWFTSTIGGVTFDLGSINLFNYSYVIPFSGQGPVIFTPASPTSFTTYHSSNLYYEAATSISGSHTWNITLPPGVVMNVVIR